MLTCIRRFVMSRANEIELYPLNRPFITVSLSTSNDLEESKKDRVRLQPCYFCPSVCSHQSIPPPTALRETFCSSPCLLFESFTHFHPGNETCHTLHSSVPNLGDQESRRKFVAIHASRPTCQSSADPLGPDRHYKHIRISLSINTF